MRRCGRGGAWGGTLMVIAVVGILFFICLVIELGGVVEK